MKVTFQFFNYARFIFLLSQKLSIKSELQDVSCHHPIDK